LETVLVTTITAITITITTTTTAANTELFVEFIEECVIMKDLTFTGNYLHHISW